MEIKNPKIFYDQSLSDTDQELIEKPSKFYQKDQFESPIKRTLFSKNCYLKNRKFKKVLSHEELDFSNKIWIGHYLDCTLARRKAYGNNQMRSLRDFTFVIKRYVTSKELVFLFSKIF